MFHWRADGLQKLEQRPGTLGKLEPVQPLVGEVASLPAHHVAHVQLGHFIVGHVAHRKAGGRNAAQHLVALRACPG